MDMSLSKPSGDGGEGNLVCCSTWGRKESHMAKRLKKKNKDKHRELYSVLYGSLDERGVWGCMDTCIAVVVDAELCLTLCDPIDCRPPGFSVHGFSRQEY